MEQKIYGLNGINSRVEFGKNGLIIDGVAASGYFEVLLEDGVTRATFRVANGANDGDAVNLGQLNLKLDANKVVTDIEATAGYIADAPTVKAAIAAQVAALINAAPSTLDTLGEIATWAEAHEDLYDALVVAVGNKLDASKVTTNIDAIAGNVPDAPTVKAAIATAVAGLSNASADITVVDTNFSEISGTQVQAVLDSVDNVLADHAGDIANLVTLSGVAANETSLGAFAGEIIPDASTVKGALQSLETKIAEVADHNAGDKCRKVAFNYQSGASFVLGDIIAAGEYVKEATVKIITPFNDIAATLHLGTDADNDRLLADSGLNIQKAGIYGDVVFDVLSADTQFKGFLSVGTSTQGSGYILVEFC